MAKVMVFTNKDGVEWESRAGKVTVRNLYEITSGLPRRKAGCHHWYLHRLVQLGKLRFKELRDE